MSGGPRERCVNVSDAEARQVLGPAGNTDGPVLARKPFSKPSCKAERRTPELAKKEKKAAMLPLRGRSPPSRVSSLRVPLILRSEQFLRSNLSPHASCSSEASTDSAQSSSSSGKVVITNAIGLQRKKLSVLKLDKNISDNASVSSQDRLGSTKKRCSWVTPNTDPMYVAFHDEEWGIPLHDDKKLFELLVLSGALAELTWPNILSKRQIFKEVFRDFDPALVSKMNEKKIVAPGSMAASLLSEPKLRAIIENARQIVKIVEEYGSFDTYCWSFVKCKPIAGRFRYPHQVPVKTSKAELISKDLVRRGFRSVGPMVIYSFMQAAGIANDHLISCYRFEECMAAPSKIVEEKKNKTVDDIESTVLDMAIRELDISQ